MEFLEERRDWALILRRDLLPAKIKSASPRGWVCSEYPFICAVQTAKANRHILPSGLLSREWDLQG